jgi:hypothetical protein
VEVEVVEVGVHAPAAAEVGVAGHGACVQQVAPPPPFPPRVQAQPEPHRTHLYDI